MAGSATSRPQAPEPSEPGQVELVLAQIDALPTLSAVAVRLLELTHDDHTGAREIAELIEADQSLSARLIAETGRAGIGPAVQTVRDAVVRLGLNAVRNLVLAVRIFETFAPRVEKAPSRFDREGFWKHSLAVGCAARLLAGQRPAGTSGWPAPEEAFLCGLVHDLGKVVFDACFPKSYDRVIARVDARQGCIADVEREVLGVDHALAGRRLARHWRLPAAIEECIWLHHHTPASTPSRIGHPICVYLVQLADRLVRQISLGYSGNYVHDGMLPAIVGDLGLNDEVIRTVTQALPDLLESRAKMIGLGNVTSRELLQETLARANVELARVNAALAVTNRSLRERSRCFEALRVLSEQLGEEPTHEQVLRAAVGAVREALPEAAVAVAAPSAGRSIALIAAGAPGRTATVQALRFDVVGDWQHLIGAAAWQPAALLGPTLNDHLAAACGRPPAWFCAARCQGRVAGVVAVAGDIPAEADDSFGVLSNWIGLWLHAAESVCVGRRLSEELAEMNRRLISSQAQVARMRSLAMVGEMAAGAAHEINGPLAVISGRAQLLARDCADPQIARTAGIISEQAHRASAIVGELMDFAKPEPPRPTRWSIGRFLEAARNRWLASGPLTEAQFRLELSDDVPDVVADEAQMRMLFDEVIRNAVEAMEGRPNPLLVVNCTGDVADERVVIRIQDNGRGMTPEVAERAMDPFFSDRPAGRRRGMGLARAARYAEINRAGIRLASRPDEGTLVIVEMPAAAE